MGTTHISSANDQFSDRVILAGDPLRMQFIADNFLSSVECINKTRGMLGFTGKYKNQSVSLLGHGMGIPSAAIYLEELFKYYNVQKVIRVGSCGSVLDNIQLNDLIIANGASTDSNFNKLKFGKYDYSPVPDFNLLVKADQVARRHIGQNQHNSNKKYHIGGCFSTDLFYQPNDEYLSFMQNMNILAIEMETSAIYALANFYKKQALTLLTVSDHITRNTHMNTQERQNSFVDMIQIALDVIIDE